MNNYIFSLCFLATIFSCSVANTQSTPKPPKWMSHKGYWVIESNVNTPKQSTIYFYNNNHQLVHQENIEGRTVNIKRNRVCKRLEETLVQSVNNWKNQDSAVKKD